MQSDVAISICKHLMKIHEVKNCTIYGSLSTNQFDEYSDIDIEVDVSGSDNGAFVLKAANLLNEIYPVIYSDYAPSLLPDEYVVSCAISQDNPFMIVDIKCTAMPHAYSIEKADMKNDNYAHILKLWVANIKHYLRGCACKSDIEKMYHKLFDNTDKNEFQMLEDIWAWLKKYGAERYKKYLLSCEKYIELIR